MPLKPSINDFGDLLEALTKEIPYQQQRFNYDFLDSLEAFLPVAQAAQSMGLESLARATAPRPQVLTEVQVEASFRAATTTEQQTSIGVQVLNLGFTRRYAYSGFVQNRVQVLVRKIASEPGKNLRETSTTQEGRND